MPEGCSGGFPHSDISGSSDICSSPKLFAAYHVFHRLLVPRHPPCALIRLTSTLCIALQVLVSGQFSRATSQSNACIQLTTAAEAKQLAVLFHEFYSQVFIYISVDNYLGCLSLNFF